MPRRMSVWPVASHTRTPDGMGIIAAPAPFHGRCQIGRRGGRNAQTGHPAKLDLDRRPSAGANAPRGRGQHNLGTTSDSLTQLLAPAIKLPGINIRPARHLGNDRARGKRRCDQRLFLILAPTSPSLGAADQLKSRHRTVSGTGANTSACTGA
jgi:hypothetical protein